MHVTVDMLSRGRGNSSYNTWNLWSCSWRLHHTLPSVSLASWRWPGLGLLYLGPCLRLVSKDWFNAWPAASTSMGDFGSFLRTMRYLTAMQPAFSMVSINIDLWCPSSPHSAADYWLTSAATAFLSEYIITTLQKSKPSMSDTTWYPYLDLPRCKLNCPIFPTPSHPASSLVESWNHWRPCLRRQHKALPPSAALFWACQLLPLGFASTLAVYRNCLWRWMTGSLYHAL